MLTLILADAELETIPDRLVGHPAIAKTAKTKHRATRRTLLNASRHHHAMRDKGLPEHERRGRPDIVHQFLLTTLDSALNLEGGLKVKVHTRHDDLITVDPATRVMRAYDRFEGLIEKLFEEGRVGPEDRDPLMTLSRDVGLPAVVGFDAPDHVIALSTEGPLVAPYEALQEVAEAHGDVTIVLGGFPKGGYKSPIDEIADETWRLHDQPLSAWVAAAEVLVPWRHLTGDIEAHRGTPPRR